MNNRFRALIVLVVTIFLINACNNLHDPVAVPTDTMQPPSTQNSFSTSSIIESTIPQSSPTDIPTSATQILPTLTNNLDVSTQPSVATTQQLETRPTDAPTATYIPPTGNWQNLPMLPSISPNAQAIYHRGLQLGRDPHVFSVVGDCQGVHQYFLSRYDYPGMYTLGSYGHLQATIDQFAGSWSRPRATAFDGFGAVSALSYLWTAQSLCDPTELPVECELRRANPSLVLITIGSNYASTYEPYISQLIEFWITQGVLPILSTKADNAEGEWWINETIAYLASYYDIPIWNFWAAVQELPNHGLKDDGVHLTFGSDGSAYGNPDDPWTGGWPVRNFTALQVIDIVWRSVNTSQ